MKKEGKFRLLAVFVTVSVLGILLYAGPANAVIVGLSVLDNSILKGNSFSFTASVNIEQNENLEIDYIALDIAGPISTTCLFLPDGTKITSCTGITIEQIETTTYNYGYGFTEGNLTYKITFNTGNYPVGTYNTKLIIFSGTNRIDQQGPELTIFSQGDTLEKCSVRAKAGTLEVGAENFGTNNKLSFVIPAMEAATKGSGSLTNQFGRTRFSYKFDVTSVPNNNNNNATIVVSGKYKINTGPEIDAVATIFFNKNTGEISIDSNDFSISELESSFRQGC